MDILPFKFQWLPFQKTICSGHPTLEAPTKQPLRRDSTASWGLLLTLPCSISTEAKCAKLPCGAFVSWLQLHEQNHKLASLPFQVPSENHHTCYQHRAHSRVHFYCFKGKISMNMSHFYLLSQLLEARTKALPAMSLTHLSINTSRAYWVPNILSKTYPIEYLI